MAFKKIDKEFLVTDSTVNVYGFRLLTSGYLVEEFKKNPIGYYMHCDPELTDLRRADGVLVRWEDFRQDGDSWFAKPVINLEHPRGEKTCEEIENGFLNGASVGKLVALEFSDDPALMLPGQTGLTVTKWYNRELSLVDIPGNFNSLSLSDKDGNDINLADLKTEKNMKQLFLTPEQIKALNLADNADQATVTQAINDLAAKAAKVDSMQTQIDTALAAKTTAETNLANLQKQQSTEKVASILDAALAAKKITNAQKAVMEKQYEGKPDELKALIDATPAYQSVTEQLSKEKGALNEKFQNLSYKELDRAGLLPELKKENLDLFKTKFKSEYGVDYKG
jgi:hypothetical protein